MTARGFFPSEMHVAPSFATSFPAPNESARRVLNILVAAVAIAVTLPLMALIAIAVALSSPGPVLYVQTRVGLNRRHGGRGIIDHGRTRDTGGVPFQMYKFRTMRVATDSAQVWARPDDDRVTAVGKVLRKLRLDELPQLFNVLRGDMNVVGPRPEQPAIFDRLRSELPSYVARQDVLPGITGWAQIHQCYDRTIADVQRKLVYDLDYIDHRSAGEDLLIMARTLPVMIGAKLGW